MWCEQESQGVEAFALHMLTVSEDKVMLTIEKRGNKNEENRLEEKQKKVAKQDYSVSLFMLNLISLLWPI